MPITRTHVFLLFLLNILLFGGCIANARAAEQVRVAAAASFRDALGEFLTGYARSSSAKVTVTYGATSNLMRQIMQGAPFDIFLAADEDSSQRLVEEGYAAGPAAILVKGRISFITRRGSGIETDVHLGGLRAAIAAGKIRRFAIANPELAPYGRAAKEALEKLGMLPTLSPLLVFGENVGQVAQYVMTGAAEAGMTANSLTRVEPMSSQVVSLELPLDLYAPINQTYVVLKWASPSALKLAEHLTSSKALAIFDRYGFAMP